MENAPQGQGELKQLRDNICRTVNSLELCWGCERICECEQWLVNEAVPVWLCIHCLSEVSFRLQKQLGVTVSPLPV